jgi:hypothetical protein
VKTNLKRGYSQQQIKQALVKVGYKPKDLNKFFTSK